MASSIAFDTNMTHNNAYCTISQSSNIWIFAESRQSVLNMTYSIYGIDAMF